MMQFQTGAGLLLIFASAASLKSLSPLVWTSFDKYLLTNDYHFNNYNHLLSFADLQPTNMFIDAISLDGHDSVGKAHRARLINWFKWGKSLHCWQVVKLGARERVLSTCHMHSPVCHEEGRLTTVRKPLGTVQGQKNEEPFPSLPRNPGYALGCLWRVHYPQWSCTWHLANLFHTEMTVLWNGSPLPLRMVRQTLTHHPYNWKTVKGTPLLGRNLFKILLV